MSTAEPHLAKIKAMVIAKWNSGPELWPVKVMSLDRVAELEKKNRRPLDRVGGYFTCLRAVRGHTPKEMEAILGFQPGYFASGAAVYRFDLLPAMAQFELRGYTQLPGGNPFDGLVIRRADQARPQFVTKDGSPFIPGLAVEQWELASGVLLPAVQKSRLGYDERFQNWR